MVTPLSPTEKEQVAELLGSEWHCADCGTTGPRKKVGRFDDYHNPNCVSSNLSPVLTLEAMFAYCRERKWRYVFAGGANASPAEVVRLYSFELGLLTEQAHDDPIVALARALLVAKEVGQ